MIVFSRLPIFFPQSHLLQAVSHRNRSKWVALENSHSVPEVSTVPEVSRREQVRCGLVLGELIKILSAASNQELEVFKLAGNPEFTLTVFAFDAFQLKVPAQGLYKPDV